MVRRLRAFLAGLLCAALLPVAALAQECFLIDIDSLDMNSVSQSEYIQQYLSAPTQGLRVRKYISDSNELAARVRLTITQAETGTVVFDKSYGYVSGTFDSGDIYLPYVDNNTIPYIVTLSIEDWTYALPFMQLRSRLAYNSGCTYGLRLRDLNPSLTDSWVMGTMLDIDALRAQGSLQLPLCASNQYVIGQATVTLAGDQLSVSLALDAAAGTELHGCAVYVIANVATMTTADPAAMAEPAYGLGQSIDVSGLRTALLYMPMLLSYDPASLAEFSYDAGSPELAAQWNLWVDNWQNGGDAATATDPLPTELPPDTLPPADAATPPLPEAGETPAASADATIIP